MKGPVPTLITVAARLPSEIIALIIHFALKDDPEMSRKQSLDCKRAKKQLIRKLRLVCKAWADYFFIHGLHDIVLTWSTGNFKIVMNRWKKRVGFGYEDTESSTPLPRVREFILHDVWDSESFRGARVTFWERESTHLDVATLTRILDVFSGHLERLHISFVDCLSFPKSTIEAVKKCTRLKYLSLSVTYDSDRLEEKRPDYRLWQAETLFDFLAAAPSLKNLTFSHWDVMTRYDLPNHQVPLCRIEELSLEGHAEPLGLSHLASVCCNINGPVKVLSIDVYNECFGGVARVTGAHARTLEALSIKTDYLFGNLDDILQGEFENLKVLKLPWQQFSQLGPILEPFVGRVETMSVDEYDKDKFQIVWTSAVPALHNLKRLFFNTSPTMASSIASVIGDNGPKCFIINSNPTISKLVELHRTESKSD